MRHEDNTEHVRPLWTRLGALHLILSEWKIFNLICLGAAATCAPESAIHSDWQQEDRLSAISGHEKLIPR